MLRDALEQIQTNYGERIIMPPVFIASESLGKYPAVAFMSENENGKDIDVAICNSSTSEVLGCMTIADPPVIPRPLNDVYAVIDEFQDICVKMYSDDPDLQIIYSDYVMQTFDDKSSILIAGLCPGAVSMLLLHRCGGNTPKAAKDNIIKLAKGLILTSKEIPKEIKEMPDWFMQIPVLKGYINAINAGNGGRLFKRLIFEGNPECFDECVQDFASYLFSMKMIDSETVFSDPSHIPSTGKHLFKNMSESTISALNLDNYGIWEGSASNIPRTGVIRVDISAVTHQEKRAKELIAQINLSVEASDFIVMVEAINPKWGDIPTDDFVNQTILAHYQNSMSDKLTESDLEWMRTYSLPQEGTPDSGTKECTTPDTPVTVQPAGDNADNAPVDSIPNTHQQNSVYESQGECIMEDDVPEPVVPELPKEDKANNAETEGDSPEQDNVFEGMRKFNEALVPGMQECYEKTVRLLREEHDVRWKDFIEAYRNALNTGEYTVLSCKKYLEVNNDIKTRVYTVLYNADKQTREYLKTIKRFSRHTRCFGCQHEWDEDITFRKIGENEGTCPNCGKTYMFIIER